jgi:hypothetical protein
MFMVREGRQGGEVRCVVIAEDESAVGTLVVIGVHVTLSTMLNIDKLSEMQHRTVEEVDTATDEADVRTPLVVGHAEGVDNAGAGDECVYLPEVVFDQ